MLKSGRCFALGLLLTLCVHSASRAETREPLIIFAAASLTDALQRVSDEFSKATGTPVKLSFAASSALAKQIEAGARADVFFSADQEWMGYLATRKLIAADTRTDVLGNRLVLIAPVDSKLAMKVGPGAPLAKTLGENGRLATGDPDSVPVGKYAKAALTNLQLWDSVQAKIARAENVRVALMYVARGEAPLGVVYATDAAAEPKVRIVDTFPESSHTPITYPVAATATAQPNTKPYLEFLRGPQATAIFKKAGFTVLSAVPAKTAECQGFKFDVSRELQLLSGIGEKLTIGASPPKAAVGRAYDVELRSQADVTFAKQPEKPTMNDGSYAGAVAITPVKDGKLRISLSEAAWIDVVANGAALTSTNHSGSHNCKLLRKAVEFNVKKAQPLTLQLSGATTATLKLLVTQ